LHPRAYPDRSEVDPKRCVHESSEAALPPWDAILVAAGRGERLGLGHAKARALLAGIPLALHSLRTLSRHPGRDRIILVLPPDEEERGEIMRWVELEPDLQVVAVPGGERRQDSVWAGLSALLRFNPPEDRVVLVHDAARPMVSHALIERCLRAMTLPMPGAAQAELPGINVRARGTGPAGVVPGLPVQETLKLVFEGRVVLTQPRENLFVIQTPQVFRFGPLLDAHQRARRQGGHATDDAALLERHGTPVILVPGDSLNLKITVPSDLAVAERLIRLESSSGEDVLPELDS
jgi:2-C-methyl-D-erythritol 4-phosphate cytidylyltransferase / 2-C-methyl-D-erythritol 2,4-cyclodiphosphate synthase